MAKVKVSRTVVNPKDDTNEMSLMDLYNQAAQEGAVPADSGMGPAVAGEGAPPAEGAPAGAPDAEGPEAAEEQQEAISFTPDQVAQIQSLKAKGDFEAIGKMVAGMV